MYEEFSPEVFRQNLVSTRKKLGFTQKQVEKELKMRVLSLYDFESGRLRPSIEVLIRMANFYQTSLEELLCLDKKESQTTIDIVKLETRTFPLLHFGIIGHDIFKLCTLISKDPAILSDVGLNEDDFHLPLLQLLTNILTERQKRNFIIELLKYINSLIGRDKKINKAEKAFRDSFLNGLDIDLLEREKDSIKRAITKPYFGKSVKNNFPKKSLKHFLIWSLYLTAYSDDDLDYREDHYIKEVGRHLEIREKDLSFIKNKILTFSKRKEQT
jgi:transcriptional regulator with XRE-family HTH domain